MTGDEVATGQVRVLIADDHTLVRVGTREMLESSPDIEVVGEAADGFDAISSARALEPDVVLLDVGMPGLNGIEALKQILTDSPGTRVLMLSVHADRGYVIESVAAGASGYLLKTVDEKQLADAILTVAAGGSVIDSSLAPVVMEQIGERSPRALSPRQIEVLGCVSEVLSNREIGERLGLSDRTVEVHLRKAFDRLGVSSRTEAVVEAMRRGWLELDR